MAHEVIETVDTPDTPDTGRSPYADYTDGARAITPMVLGVVPFGIAIGAVAASAHLPTLTGLAGSVMLIGGSAQLALIQQLDAGVTGVVAIFAALLINARLLVYGAGLAPWFPNTSIRKRLLLALPLVDQLYLVAITAFPGSLRDERARRRFYAGAALHIWVAFIAAQILGALAGSSVPGWLGLGSASSISLSALLAVAVSSRTAMRAALAAGVVMAATSSFGAPSLLLVAMLGGVAVGWASMPRRTEVTP